MNEKWTIIDTLRYARHDWLNRLQMIKGNIALGKIERTERIIDEIVLEMQQETMLTNLQLPLFAELLLTHNWKENRFTIEYEVIQKTKQLNLDDHRLTEWMARLFQWINEGSLPAYENQLYITLNMTDENSRFLFQFNGIIENIAEFKKLLIYEESYPVDTSFLQEAQNEWVFEAVFN